MHKLVMNPAPGERVLRFVGDQVQFSLRPEDGTPLPPGWRAFLRTNLGRAAMVRQEIVQACMGRIPLAGASWRDIPLTPTDHGWQLEMPLHEVGYFKAKAYAVDEKGWQHWPDGPDAGICIHPDYYRTANTIYCAFTRLFGATKSARQARDPVAETRLAEWDQKGCAVIPPSGTLRDLARQLPHILEKLGCRILHLLPINPTPTTYARFGRYGSPYAAMDFTAIDPALVEFDRKTTAVDQFCELTYAVHARGGRVFLDLAINHTGWGSTLINEHPEWFQRESNGTFISPGAWGNTWEDLVELAHRTPDLWDNLAKVFLTWCHRGVDGFRCDAGYKVPVAAWQYLIARVRQEFPDTLFLLEGLGGSWEATETLLTEGGMQWAYSELFQNYSGREVAAYLDYSLQQSQRSGIWVHYSETHDNLRLAAQGKAWSLLRNRLCALTSVCGGFGFTSGVEWLADEKINVHNCTGLAWDNPENLVPELRSMMRLLNDHPCFFDGALLNRLSPPDSPVYALQRISSNGEDQVLALINTDLKQTQTVEIDSGIWFAMGEPRCELLGQSPPPTRAVGNGKIELALPAATAFCLAATPQPKGLHGNDYRQARALAAWGILAASRVIPEEQIGIFEWQDLARFIALKGPETYLASLFQLREPELKNRLVAALENAAGSAAYQPVISWRQTDCRRIVLVPPRHWLVVSDNAPFRANFKFTPSGADQHLNSTQVGDRHLVCLLHEKEAGNVSLTLQRFASEKPVVAASLVFLGEHPSLPWFKDGEFLKATATAADAGLVLLTNGLGSMARICVDLGHIKSKYDCLLGANLHPDFPVDRHVFAKRARAWVNADGFLSPLDELNLISVTPGPPATWKFLANAGDGRSVEIHLLADMPDQRNTTILRFSRPRKAPPQGRDLPDECDVRLTVRIDIEDRNFHQETQHNGGADHHFQAHTRPLAERIGFGFQPAQGRELLVFSDAGLYHHQPEWCDQIPFPVEQSRGQTGSGDAFSPGWFELPLAKGSAVHLTVSADQILPTPQDLRAFNTRRERTNENAITRAKLSRDDSFGQQLAVALQAFVVRRNEGKTIIAGYPWFLDWGRDTFICARGLLAAGMLREVNQLLAIFGAFEENGTLPNVIHGADASNRDTSDAPLWFGLVCEEAAAFTGDELYRIQVDRHGRKLGEVLRQIALGYLNGTPNGIRMDPESGLVWSPRHFTWMDTNFPAATPREGYPIEIQVLWIRLLRHLERLEIRRLLNHPTAIAVKNSTPSWSNLATLAEKSFHQYYWSEERGYLADLLIAASGEPAHAARVDHALRCNCLLAISLDLVSGVPAQRTVEAARQHLLIPGALRSLAPLPVFPPLPVHGNDGRLLNDPAQPYWGSYEGDEDTRRKPAYHNGTAWTWFLPVFCEALAKAWNLAPEAVQAARACLGSMDRIMSSSCLGQIPEILDGDAPHLQRGCDAQAWGVAETLRVWKWLNSPGK